MKKIFLFLLLCLTFATSWAQPSIVRFNGTTSLRDFTHDYTDVLGDGTISYSASKNTFTFTSASLESLYVIGDCTIELNGASTVTNTNNYDEAVLCSGHLTFKGAGSLVAYAHWGDVAFSATAVDFGPNLGFIEGGNDKGKRARIGVADFYDVWVDGTRLNSVNPGTYDVEKDVLTLSGYYTSVRTTTGGTTIKLTGDATITNPNGYAIEFEGQLGIEGVYDLVLTGKQRALNSTNVNATGGLDLISGIWVGQSLTIGLPATFPIYINGEQLTKTSDYICQPDMFAIGYIPSTNTLRLRNCDFIKNIRVTEGNLNVLLVSDNSITNTTGYAIEVPGTLTFNGLGTITLTGASRAIQASRVVLNDGMTYQSGNATTKVVTIGEEVEPYELYINGEQVKSNSPYVKNAGKGRVSYYPDEHKLVLNNSVDDIHTLSYEEGPLDPLSIYLEGSNAITDGDGVTCYGTINFYGTGSLVIRTNGAPTLDCGMLYFDGDLGIKNGSEHDTYLYIAGLDYSRDVYSHAFAVSPTEMVQFTLGNLKSNTETYTFAASQTEVGGQYNYITTCDINWQEQRMASAGNKNGFRMLSSEEVEYIINARPNAFFLRGLATIAGKMGLLLLPDDWQLPAGLTFTPSATLGSQASFNNNVYTESQMKTLEDAGAVFLPEDPGAPVYMTSTSTYDGVTRQVCCLMLANNSVGVKVGDVTYVSDRQHCLIRLVKDCSQKPIPFIEGDLNHDGKITVADVNILVDKALEK